MDMIVDMSAIETAFSHVLSDSGAAFRGLGLLGNGEASCAQASRAPVENSGLI